MVCSQIWLNPLVDDPQFGSTKKIWGVRGGDIVIDYSLFIFHILVRFHTIFFVWSHPKYNVKIWEKKRHFYLLEKQAVHSIVTLT